MIHFQTTYAANQSSDSGGRDAVIICTSLLLGPIAKILYRFSTLSLQFLLLTCSEHPAPRGTLQDNLILYLLFLGNRTSLFSVLLQAFELQQHSTSFFS